MSKSTPLKRKLPSSRNNQLPISSESDDDIQKIVRPKTSKRLLNQQPSNDVDLDVQEDTGIFCLVQFLGKLSDYGIVAEKLITIDLDEPQIGKVKHYSKTYAVKILKKGTYEYVEMLAEKFKFNLSLNTSEESETDRQLMMLKMSNTKNNTTSTKNAEQDIMDKNFLEKEISSCSQNLNHCEPSINLPVETSLPIISQSQNIESLIRQNQDCLARQQETINVLLKKVENLNKPLESKSFVINGIDLINDVHGYPAHQWAANCLKVIFTKEEAKNHVLVATKKSSRTPCCPNKVNLLKEALKFKYNFPAEKNDKVWKTIVNAFNSKGRSFKAALKDATNNLIGK
ncbi:unnamed protein product [Brachionus calyciflorus]|uniref:BEN domain-containing protein n=1 Tax=Brachionus calyciflorus TaxID=104777 RepID=A0A814CXK4_9BILA|nr:unnamed protein product [Brachionus calyciflorus]